MRILKKILVGVLAGALSCSLFGAVPQVYTENGVAEAAGAVNILDYEKNTSASEYAVYDVAGMEYLAELVNDRHITFSGKTISLESDLKYDKSVKNNHTPIGSAGQKFDYSFCGSFNGKDHVISGININYVGDATDNSYLGLFGHVKMNNNVIQAIHLSDSIIVDNSEDTNGGCGHHLGGIGGILIGTNGKLENCTTDSSVKLYAYYSVYVDVGGIVGEAYGTTIRKCVNNAYVYSNDGASGITGYLSDDSKCEKSINYGEVIGKKSASGIARSLSWGSNVVEECCNYGTVKGVHVAGISNGMYDKSQVRNCYNVGKVITDDTTWTEIAGGLLIDIGSPIVEGHPVLFNSYSAGKLECITGSYGGAVGVVDGKGFAESRLPVIKKVYWDENINTVGVNTEQVKSIESGKKAIDTSSVYSKTSEQMKHVKFVAELNANSVAEGYGEVWAQDSQNINDGYPILKNVPYTNSSSIPNDDPEPYIDPEETAETGATVSKLFKDYTYQNPVREDSVRLYANGGTVMKNKVKTNYKSYTLYTKILPSYIYKLDTKGNLKKSNGKVVVGITSTKTKPTLNAKGAIVDAAAANIAKASIANGQITVTAQTMPGTVYLWVMDTGDLSRSSDKDEVAQTYTCCPVTVRSAPTVIGTYNTSSITYGTTKKYTSKALKVGEATDIFLYPVYKDNNKKMQKAEDATYEAVPANNIKDYIKVIKTSKETFRIRTTGLKNGKKVSGKVTFKCNQNGKTVAFTVTVKK